MSSNEIAKITVVEKTKAGRISGKASCDRPQSMVDSDFFCTVSPGRCETVSMAVHDGAVMLLGLFFCVLLIISVLEWWK